MRAGSCSTCMLHSMGERSIGLWRAGGHGWLRARCQSGRVYTLAMRSCPVWLVVSKHLPRMRSALRWTRTDFARTVQSRAGSE